MTILVGRLQIRSLTTRMSDRAHKISITSRLNNNFNKLKWASSSNITLNRHSSNNNSRWSSKMHKWWCSNSSSTLAKSSSFYPDPTIRANAGSSCKPLCHRVAQIAPNQHQLGLLRTKWQTSKGRKAASKSSHLPSSIRWMELIKWLSSKWINTIRWTCSSSNSSCSSKSIRLSTHRGICRMIQLAKILSMDRAEGLHREIQLQ